MISDYKTRRNEALASYDSIERLAAEIQNYSRKINVPDPIEKWNSLLTDIRNKAEKVRADKFTIMVAGEAKSGKSTFINAYLGMELLPMDVKQCTSAIVEIKYGETFSVEATYADGRKKKITDREKARDFLKKNAALDDAYRDIPVPTINSEILVKSGLRARARGKHISISKAEVEAMLKAPEVQAANIHNLPDYNDRIRRYIEKRKNSWQDIVTKIEVLFPFEDESLRGIEIIDSPGVCARGGVSKITSHYIERADAIIFLKTISGQSLESTQFKQFIESVSAERNKNVLFLALTHAADVTEKEIHRLEEEALKQFSNLDKDHILIVDSKAELYAHTFSHIEDIEVELRRLNAEGALDAFAVKAYNETNGLFGSGDFIEKLRELSRFQDVDTALERFGRQAHYLLLMDLLDSIETLYAKLWNDIDSHIELFAPTAENPKELERKRKNVKIAVKMIKNKIPQDMDTASPSHDKENMSYIKQEGSVMVTDYKTRKNEVLKLCDDVQHLVTEIREYSKQIELPDPTEGRRALLTDIRNKAEKVKADQFTIMVAGEAKSGKSTFINAYLGMELLPMDVKQCTSAIVEIKYGETFSVEATYADGRKKKITDREKARDFLKKNAALDDAYREIPVPTINSEILVKSGLRARAKRTRISISKAEVEAMLKAPEVQAANIHNLPDYNDRIRRYIEKRKNSWQDIVTKIEVLFPFEDESLRGIEIIDSPGVCARGGVSEITSGYIERADAIIFLKPISGQSLESTQFKQFMESVSVERNKSTLFLVLTRAADVTEKEIHRLEEEALKQFSNLDKDHILIVDSKAELYAHMFSHIEDIEAELRRLNAAGTLDAFAVQAYNETNGLFGSGDFVETLREISRFQKVDSALERFGRQAHYLLLAELLASMEKVCAKFWAQTISHIELLTQKNESKEKLDAEIKKRKDKIIAMGNGVHHAQKNIMKPFLGNGGIIEREVKAAITDFLESIERINPEVEDSFEQLEKLSLQIIDQLQDFIKKLQERVVEACNDAFETTANKLDLKFAETLEPDFTHETFQQIKEATESAGYEIRSVEEGITFTKTHTYSVYTHKRHFDATKANIKKRLGLDKAGTLENDVIDFLYKFTENIYEQYTKELSDNINREKMELTALQEKRMQAEKIWNMIQELSILSGKFSETIKEIGAIKGGIEKK